MTFWDLKDKKKKTKTNIVKTNKSNFFKLEFPTYLTSHTNTKHLRKYIASEKKLAKMDRVKINSLMLLGKPKKISKRNLSWPQAKRRFPLLPPMKDADKDGVINLLDCRPFNRQKQGWKHQECEDNVVIQIPIKRAYHLRGEYSKYRKGWALNDSEAWKRARAMREASEKKGDSLDYDKSERMAFKQMAEEKAKKLAKKDYKIHKIGTSNRKGGGVTGGYVTYSASPKAYKREIRSTMKPEHTSDPFTGEHKTSSEKKYVEKISKALKSDKPEIIMIKSYAKDLKHGSSGFGEGRHRILAAIKAGHKTIPVEVVDVYEGHEGLKELRIQEARDKSKMKDSEPAPEVLEYDLEEEDDITLDLPGDEDESS